MKVSAQTIIEPVAEEKSWASVFSELVKARLTTLVVLTTLVGYYAGSSGKLDIALMFHAVLGTALVACGAAALNQLLERNLDAKMDRTEDRPLPSKRMQPNTVLLIGAALSATGLIYLAFAVNPLTSLLGCITLVSYLFVYTPLKRVTTLNTAVGAIPGAIPPLMGWTAATGEISAPGWALFAILFFWQLPHFLAIAWMYREDYAKAGFAMLPVVDPEGRKTGASAVSHTFGLLPVSLSPVVLKMAGGLYAVGALVLGLIFLWYAIQFARSLNMQRARQLFFVSIIYLPLLFSLLVIDKIK
ncbi:MAG: heme o synthase [Verrucomicrobiales bacterium]